MSDQDQSKQLSQAVAEVGRLRSEIKTALREFDESNASAALSRLRAVVEPMPQVHILVFPATPGTLRSVCGERKFGEKDMLMPSKDSIDPTMLRTHVLCPKCSAQRTTP
jgi:hypothetical protein